MEAYARVSQLRMEFLAEFDSWTNDQLAFSPTENSWNAVQVANHLATVEGMSIAKIKQHLDKPKPKVGLKNKLKFWLYMRAMKTNRKFPAPAIVKKLSERKKDLEAVKNDWAKAAVQWKEVLANTDLTILSRGILKHPICGFINADQAIRFLEEHVKHHQTQIERLKKHPEFPKP